MDVNKKRQNEQEILCLMIRIYCQGNHKNKKGICKDCQELLEYAVIKTQKCPFMETKTFCSACKVHCYASDRQEKIQQVMKYAGTRMIVYHPFMAVRHLFVILLEKKGK